MTTPETIKIFESLKPKRVGEGGGEGGGGGGGGVEILDAVMLMIGHMHIQFLSTM